MIENAPPDPSVPTKSDPLKGTDVLSSESDDSIQTVEISDTAVQAIVQIASKSHRGPIPDPESFERYEKCLAGSADRILKMAEKEQDARLIQTPIDRKREYKGRLWGQSYGFASLILMMGCATVIAVLCKSSGAYVLAGAMVAAPLLNHVEKVSNFFRKKDSD